MWDQTCIVQWTRENGAATAKPRSPAVDFLSDLGEDSNVQRFLDRVWRTALIGEHDPYSAVNLLDQNSTPPVDDGIVLTSADHTVTRIAVVFSGD